MNYLCSYQAQKQVENLTLHIQYLLRRHSCVIMPRLGALIATERSAVVNEEWGRVQAPVREICFNAAIVNNDGLLATSIARREQISYEAACRRMEQAIDKMKQMLDDGAEVTLGRIGSLRRSADGPICFTPAMPARRQAEALGYYAVELPGKDGNVESQNPATKRDSRFYHLRIPKVAVKYAASLFLPVIAAMSIFMWILSVSTYPDAADGANRIDYASVIPIKESSDIRRQNNAAESVTPPAYGKQAEEGKGVIVVAVFKSENKAQQFIAQHHSSPFNLSVRRYADTYRIAAGGEHPRNLLEELILSSTFRTEFPDAWIWEF